jgi:hypothetical protein
MSEQKYAARIYVSDFVDEQAVWEKINSLGVVLEITTTLDPMRGGQYIDVLFLKNENEITGTNFLSSKGRIISSHTYEKLPKKTYDYDVKEDGIIYVPELNKTYEPSPYEVGVYSEKTVTYKEMYWKFVNSGNAYEAADNLSKMLDLVTEDMEPAEGMHSWVKDPEERKLKEVVKIDDKMPLYVHISMYVGLGLMMAAIILQLGFGITL